MNINGISFNLVFYYIIALVRGDCSNNQPVVEYYDFDDDQYVFFSQKLTWDEASMVCTAHNGRLAVLDTLDKATNVAHAMADSNIGMRDAWIAGRRLEITWLWTDGTNFTSSGSVIQSEPGIENFPPWAREPTRSKKECLALDRMAHSHPSFIDLDCRLLKPFICQKSSQDTLNTPVPAKWISVDKSMYILYHGQVTWAEAVTFCRLQGTRLAVIKNQNALDIITSNMIKSRPDFESAWIGAHYSHGQWTWLSTGSAISPISDTTGYPPWRSGKPEKNSGCLMVDRHLDRYADFIEIPCDRKRDFVCEEYPPEESEEWENQPVRFTHENKTFSIYPNEKTWDESRLYCQEIGGSLGYVDSFKLAHDLVLEMGDHPKELSHLWVGGIYLANVSEWRWIHNNEVFPSKSNESYQPWADILMETDVSSEEMLCLNLDKTDHSKPHIYGLDCESKQSFVCVTDCRSPPGVTNGEWECSENSDVLECTYECTNSYHLMGLNIVKCSADIGWFNYNEELIPPLCLNISDYVQRMLRALSQDILKSSGYYILLSHSNEKMRSLSFNFVEKLLNIFPLSKYLKMGMTTSFTNSSSNISYKQNDTCTALNLINSVKTGNHQSELTQKKFSDWSKEIMRNKKERSVIIAFLDSDTAAENQGTFEKLKSQSHYVVAIGLKNDWEKLLPLPTIGFEQRINLYLFEQEQEYALFIDEFNKLIDKTQKNCADTENTKNTTKKPPSPPEIVTSKEFENDENKSAENVTTETTVITTKESAEPFESTNATPENISEKKADDIAEKMADILEKEADYNLEKEADDIPSMEADDIRSMEADKIPENKTNGIPESQTITSPEENNDETQAEVPSYVQDVNLHEAEDAISSFNKENEKMNNTYDQDREFDGRNNETLNVRH